VIREQTELALISAGWEISEDFSLRRLLIGHSGNLSILAYGSESPSDEPMFELVDGERGTTYWVRVIPTPRVAAVLVKKHGGAPEEERGNPYKRYVGSPLEMAP
jgi:hypothetical protein